MTSRVVGNDDGSTGPADATAPTRLPDPFVPFPIDECPPVIAEFLREGSAAFQADPAFFVGPLFAAMGAAIGNSRTALLKSGFATPPLLWTATVAPSGSSKSPTQRAALAPTWKRQHDALAEYEAEVNAYIEAKADFDAKKKSEREEGEVAPRPPVLKNFIVSDTTTEALGVRLLQNPRGLLCGVDEVAGLLKSFNAYKQRGGDKESWLSFYDATTSKIDRKTSAIGTIIIKAAFVALCGGIQPGVLAGVLADEDFDNGFAARFLFTMPPVQRCRWSEDVIAGDTTAAIGRTVESLYGLEARGSDDGQVEPRIMALLPDAKRAWGEWFNEVADEIDRVDDEESPYAICLPKVRTVAARLAIILQLVSHVSGEREGAYDDDNIAGTSMRRGIAIARWWKGEQARVYAALSISKAKRRLVKFAKIIAGMGGRVSVRDWQNHRRSKNRDAAESELQTVVDAGLAAWSYTQNPNGGRPSKIATLCDITPDSDSKTGVTKVGLLGEIKGTSSSLSEDSYFLPTPTATTDKTPRHGHEITGYVNGHATEDL